MIIVIYIDDILIFEGNNKNIKKIQDLLTRQFKMTDLDEMSHYLDMEIDIDDGKTSIYQTNYLTNVLNYFRFNNCKSCKISMNSDTVNHIESFTEQADKETIVYYQSAIDFLMWAVMMTQPDLTYLMSILSCYLDNSDKEHLALLKTVFRYVSETLNIELTFTDNTTDDLIEYTDADFAEAIDDCKLTGDYMFMLVEECISHQAKHQTVVTLLSCESEYMTMSEADKETMWMKWFLKKIDYQNCHESVILYDDNQSAIALTKNSYDNQHSKHIDVWYHWIRNHVNEGKINLKWVLMTDMTADSLTKSLLIPEFTRFKSMIDLV